MGKLATFGFALGLESQHLVDFCRYLVVPECLALDVFNLWHYFLFLDYLADVLEHTESYLLHYW